MPRWRSSGALSMLKKSRYSAIFFCASTFVIADVSVVLPWSIWPIVPTLRCGFVRTNFCLAMRESLLLSFAGQWPSESARCLHNNPAVTNGVHLMPRARPEARQGTNCSLDHFPISHFAFPFSNGAHDRTRTGDPVLTKNVLYQLSYVGATQNPLPCCHIHRLVAGGGFEPP